MIISFNSDDVWTLGEIAEMLGISVQAPYQWRKSEGFPKPVHKYGATYLYDRDEVTDWLVETKRATIKPDGSLGPKPKKKHCPTCTCGQ